MLSNLSTVGDSGFGEKPAKPLEAVAQGYGQNDTLASIGFVVKNPNADQLIANSQYMLILYTEDGNIAGVESGYIERVLPNEELGVASGLVSVLENTTAVSSVLYLYPGKVDKPSDIPEFTTEKAEFVPDAYFPKVTVNVKNSYTKPVTNVKVSAVLYDEAGKIIGGGSTYLESIPANGAQLTEISVVTTAKPAKIVTYATVSSLSTFGE